MHWCGTRPSCSAAWAIAGLLLLGACDSKEEKKEDPVKEPITIQGKAVELGDQASADAAGEESKAEGADVDADAEGAEGTDAEDGGDPADEAGDAEQAAGGDAGDDEGDAPPEDGGEDEPDPKPSDAQPKSGKKTDTKNTGDKKADDKKADDKKADDKKADETKTASADGKTLYLKKCKNCHGVTGEADTKIGQKHDIPSWKESGWKSKWPHAKVVDIVTEGKSGTKMKAFEGKLTPEEIQAVSKYARSLGK